MTNSTLFSVNVVTPAGKIYDSDQVSMLVVKTKDGQLGILSNHVPVVASLIIDEAIIKLANTDKEDVVAVNGGFVEFNNNIATIVADSAEKQSDIDVDRAQRAKDRAEQNITKAQNSNDDRNLRRARVALRRATNRINVSKK